MDERDMILTLAKCVLSLARNIDSPGLVIMQAEDIIRRIDNGMHDEFMYDEGMRYCYGQS